MTLAVYEPPPLEIKITLILGLSVLSPYYRGFVKSLNLRGDERVLSFGSGSGVCSRHIATNPHPATVNTHKVATISVYDAQFIR